MSKGRALAGKLPNTMRRDPGEAGTTFFGFVDLPQRGDPPVIEPQRSALAGRRGVAERDLLVEKGELLHISLTGWYTDKVSLNDRQARFLRDALNSMLVDA
jgi:hypothetical protein